MSQWAVQMERSVYTSTARRRPTCQDPRPFTTSWAFPSRFRRGRMVHAAVPLLDADVGGRLRAPGRRHLRAGWPPIRPVLDLPGSYLFTARNAWKRPIRGGSRTSGGTRRGLGSGRQRPKATSGLVFECVNDTSGKQHLLTLPWATGEANLPGSAVPAASNARYTPATSFRRVAVLPPSRASSSCPRFTPCGGGKGEANSRIARAEGPRKPKRPILTAYPQKPQESR